jgi:hypothetical protein
VHCNKNVCNMCTGNVNWNAITGNVNWKCENVQTITAML